MSAAGIWVGSAVTPDIPDVFTSFEGPDDSNGFQVGTSPFAADFQGGVTETRGVPGFYASGLKSWHIGVADGAVDFETPVSTLTLFTRTVPGGAAEIDVKDTGGAVIQTIVVPDAGSPQEFTVNAGAGTLIGSADITVSSGEIVIDDFSFGYPSTASTDDIACVFAPEPENDFVCVVTDSVSSDLLASANGTFQVNDDQVTGAGNLYAAPGETLIDGSTIAPLTLSDGTVVESTSLDATVDSVGLAIAVTSVFDDTYDRGADLATVAAMYTTFDIFGDMSSFDVDASGVISGQSASGCVLSGQVSVIDAAANAYAVNLIADAATCGALAGDYNGLGSTQDEAATDDAFIFAVFVDGVSMIVAEAIK